MSTEARREARRCQEEETPCTREICPSLYLCLFCQSRLRWHRSRRRGRRPRFTGRRETLTARSTRCCRDVETSQVRRLRTRSSSLPVTGSTTGIPPTLGSRSSRVNSRCRSDLHWTRRMHRGIASARSFLSPRTFSTRWVRPSTRSSWNELGGRGRPTATTHISINKRRFSIVRSVRAEAPQLHDPADSERHRSAIGLPPVHVEEALVE